MRQNKEAKEKDRPAAAHCLCCMPCPCLCPTIGLPPAPPPHARPRPQQTSTFGRRSGQRRRRERTRHLSVNLLDSRGGLEKVIQRQLASAVCQLSVSAGRRQEVGLAKAGQGRATGSGREGSVCACGCFGVWLWCCVHPTICLSFVPEGETQHHHDDNLFLTPPLSRSPSLPPPIASLP